MDHDTVAFFDTQFPEGGFQLFHRHIFLLFVEGKSPFDSHISQCCVVVQFRIKSLKGFMFRIGTGRPDRFGNFKDALFAVKVVVVGS